VMFADASAATVAWPCGTNQAKEGTDHDDTQSHRVR
jgi:hypothetical protein